MKANAADRSAFESAWPRSLRGEGANGAGNLLHRKSTASRADKPRFKSNVERFPTPVRCDVALRRGVDIRCARVGSGAAAGRRIGGIMRNAGRIFDIAQKWHTISRGNWGQPRQE